MPVTGPRVFAFCDATMMYHYLSRNPIFANTIHLPYKHDPNNINGIHMCFFRVFMVIAKIIK